VVRHEETLTSSRYVFLKHTVMAGGMERPVGAGDVLLDMSRVQWNVRLRWRQL
jgi:hypothetical protein